MAGSPFVRKPQGSSGLPLSDTFPLLQAVGGISSPALFGSWNPVASGLQGPEWGIVQFHFIDEETKVWRPGVPVAGCCPASVQNLSLSQPCTAFLLVLPPTVLS